MAGLGAGAGKPKVLRSINAPGEALCVDIFQRADGSYGFEEYRRDPEDGRGWFPIGGHAAMRFASAEAALAAAETAIVWLTA